MVKTMTEVSTAQPVVFMIYWCYTNKSVYSSCCLFLQLQKCSPKFQKPRDFPLSRTNYSPVTFVHICLLFPAKQYRGNGLIHHFLVIVSSDSSDGLETTEWILIGVGAAILVGIIILVICIVAICCVRYRQRPTIYSPSKG